MAARSARWNSGRLVSSSAMHCPRSRPRRASPPASASTRSRISPHVIDTSSPLVRTNTASGLFAAVMRNASANVAASIARRAAVPDSMSKFLPGKLTPGEAYPRSLSDAEALARQAPDVVGEADHEDEEHEHDADVARALHDRERDRPAAQLLGQREEDVAAVEGQEREEVDDAQRQRDHRQQEQRLRGGELERLACDLVGADHAGGLL